MYFFWEYLKSRVKVFCLVGICIVTLLISFSLYQLPMVAVLYPMGLCLCIGLIFFAFDYARAWKKHKILDTEIKYLQHLLEGESDGCTDFKEKKNLSADLELFGAVESVTESDYRKLVEAICEENGRVLQHSFDTYRDMTEYYTMWVHQIKTPIASMRLALQGEDTDFSRRLQMDLGRIENYVNMVLTYMRLESDSSDFRIAAYDLDDMVRTSIKKYTMEFITKHLTMEYEPMERTVLTDEKWLCFVLEQIIGNALKYTEAGKITIASMVCCREKQRCLILQIKDTGIGIAPEDLPRIFENGYTGINGRLDKKASGIGLYLCKRVLDQLGHAIWIESEVGEGTCVNIELPLEQDLVRD